MSAHFPPPYRTAPDSIEAIRAELDGILGRVDIAMAEADPAKAEEAEPLARVARELFTRRALEQAADLGAAMLDALDLPQLDALDAAIVALDAMEADPDLEDGADDEATGDEEPALGAAERHPVPPPSGYCDRWGAYAERSEAVSQRHWAGGATHDGEAVNEDGDTLDEDGEHDTADLELSCGWTEKVDQLRLGVAQDEAETTSLERHGRGFVRSGPEDAEDDELGEEGPPDPVAWVFGPSRAGVAHA